MTKDNEKGIEGVPASVALVNSKDFIAWMEKAHEGLKRFLKKTRVKKPFDKVADPIFNWGLRWSVWPLHFGIACCAVENPFSLYDPRFDAMRWGMIPRSSPRQCDILMVNGTVTKKLRPRLRRLYEQMPEPKWVVAIGACAISGGPFAEGYHVVKGVDTFIPVDIYVPGCPPRPESFIEAYFKLQEKIKREYKGFLKV
jgi:NADH-quinone oxidoreductase subunit B